MKRFSKKLRGILMVAAMSVAVCAAPAKADDDVYYVTYSAKGNKLSNQYTTYTYALDSSVTKLEAKSSNKKIATVKVTKAYGRWAYTVTVKKAGSFTITRKVYSHDQEDGDMVDVFKRAYKAVKYATPIKTLKVGKKTLTSTFKKSSSVKGKKLSGKLTIKMKKGYKLESVYKFPLNGFRPDSDLESTPYSNGDKISVKKGERFVIRYSKGTQTFSLLYTVK